LTNRDTIGAAGHARARVEDRREIGMSVARVTEITSQSPRSFEDAIRQGIRRANETLRNVSGAWVKEQQIAVENGRITGYRVNMLVTFVLEDGRGRAAAAPQAAKTAPAKKAASKRASSKKSARRR
jgi:flavin-binding protein dodecin